MQVHLLSALTLATLAHSHGIVTSPPIRVVGPAMQAACGQQVFNNLNSNPLGPIEQMAQIGASQPDFNAATCNLAVCKGLKLEDSTSNVQRFAPGQVVPFTVEIQAKHTGSANVSVVDPGANAMISDILVDFPVYASTSAELPANQTAFNVTMPDMGSKCADAGKCVVMWWWNSPDARQTYMSCVDFTM